jgi:fructoselysine 3-epimerase
MELAFSTNAFSRHSLSHALAAIAAAGYAGAEILADKPHWYPADFDAAEAETIRDHLTRLNLAVSNINANCTFGYWQDPPPEPFFEPSLISPQPRLRADRIRMIQNTLHFAKAVGASNISITSGKALPTMPPEAAMRQLRQSLSPVLETAEKLNIHVGIECEPMLFIEWAAELRDLIDTMGSRLLGANLDIGHSVVLGEDIPAILRLLSGRIWNCHIEDIPGRKHYHLIPGTGTMDWAKLKDSLDAIKYDRFLTVELYTYPDRPAEAAQESIAYLNAIFFQ